VILAYSYIRFSSRQQRRGNSLARQTKKSEEWCHRNKASLDTSITLHDLATSGFTGAHHHRDNADKYALAGFLALVEAGNIPKGSYLIVENLDRITREDIVPAVNLFTGLLMAGIKIVQLIPIEQVFDRDADMARLMLAVMELSRGNSESKLKSERVGSAWRERKNLALATKAPVSAMCPKWLRLVGARKVGNKMRGGKYEPIPERVEIVRQIFRWSIDGHGIGVIARMLNAGGFEPFGERGEEHAHLGKPRIWQKSSVARILRNRAVLGEYQPGEGSKRVPAAGLDLIPDYYPRVVEDREFSQAQGAIQNRKGKRSDKKAESRNLFTGLLKTINGKPYNYHRSANDTRGYEYLVPSDGRLTEERYISIPYSAVERVILGHFREIRPSDLTSKKDGKRADRLGELGAMIEEAKVKVRAFEDKIYGEPTNNTWPKLMARAKAEVDQYTAEYQELRIELASPVVESMAEAQSLMDAAADPEKRTRLRAKIGVLVEVIGLHVWEDNFSKIDGPDSKVVSEPFGQLMKVAWVQIKFKRSPLVRNIVFSFTPGYGKVRPTKVHVYAAGDAPLAELDFTEDNAVDVERFFAHGEIGRPKEI
jgi:DNA invertase Pin-like site-specific DNA recombinase